MHRGGDPSLLGRRLLSRLFGVGPGRHLEPVAPVEDSVGIAGDGVHHVRHLHRVIVEGLVLLRDLHLVLTVLELLPPLPVPVPQLVSLEQRRDRIVQFLGREIALELGVDAQFRVRNLGLVVLAVRHRHPKTQRPPAPVRYAAAMMT